MAYFTKRYHPPGTAPGTLTGFEGEEALPVDITLVDYTPTDYTEIAVTSTDEIRKYLEKDSVTWIHVQGHVSVELLTDLGAAFDLHSLALEDVLNEGQRPKTDVYDDLVFVVCAQPFIQDNRIQIEQASFFYGHNFLISIHAGDADPFIPVRKRLRTKNGRIRHRGADYLLYALIDIVIDQGFPLLEQFGEEIEELETEVLESPNKETISHIHRIKRELLLLRRMLWPQREVINVLLRDESPLIQSETRLYLRDCYDHTVQIMDLLETYRDMTASMLDVYLSSVSNRTNDIMRVLTIIATIFIPLTFVVGVYGMNFNDSPSPWAMPELGWYYGYPLIWIIMILIAIAMLFYFRKKDWL